MIVYDKLAEQLNQRSMKFIDLQREMNFSPSLVAKFSNNRNLNTDTINKVCEYLQVQPGDIMEWIPDADWIKKEEEAAQLEAQIAELQAQLKKIKK